MVLLIKQILFLSLVGASLVFLCAPTYAQGCLSSSSGGCAPGVSGQSCSTGPNGNSGLCTPTDDNSSCDCMSATLGEYTLTVGPLSPSAVNPGGSATSTVTVTSIGQSNGFFQGLVSLSCSTNGSAAVSCSLNPAQVFVNGNRVTANLSVSTFSSLPLNPGGTGAGTYPITVTGVGQFGTTPQNGAQSVSLSVTHSGGGGNIGLVVFLTLLSLWMLRRSWREAKGNSR